MKFLSRSFTYLALTTAAFALPDHERRETQQLALKPIADDLFKADTGYQLIKLNKLPTSTSSGWEVAGAAGQNVKLTKEANGWIIGGQEAQGCYGWNTYSGSTGIGWQDCSKWELSARIWNVRCDPGKYVGWQNGGTTATGFMCTFFHGDSADANCLGSDLTKTNAPLQPIQGLCKIDNPTVDQVLYVFPRGNV